MRAIGKWLSKNMPKVSDMAADGVGYGLAGAQMVGDAGRAVARKHPIATGALMGGLGAYVGSEALEDDPESPQDMKKKRLQQLLRMLEAASNR